MTEDFVTITPDSGDKGADVQVRVPVNLGKSREVSVTAETAAGTVKEYVVSQDSMPLILSVGTKSSSLYNALPQFIGLAYQYGESAGKQIPLFRYYITNLGSGQNGQFRLMIARSSARIWGNPSSMFAPDVYVYYNMDYRNPFPETYKKVQATGCDSNFDGMNVGYADITAVTNSSNKTVEAWVCIVPSNTVIPDDEPPAAYCVAKVEFSSDSRYGEPGVE